MKKKLIIGFIAVVVLIIMVVLLLLFSNGQKSAETQLQNDNPIFHTVLEGGICRDGKGDCVGGLTCSNGKCAKP